MIAAGQAEPCKACETAPMSPLFAPFCASCNDDLCHLYALLYGDLRFCGCGNPEQVYGLVRDLLGLAPFYDNPDLVRERVGGPSPEDHGPYYLVLYVLDHAGLISHGGSIGGSWLTPKGEHYLGLMRRYEHGLLDEAGYPHDGGRCTEDCRHWQAATEEYAKGYRRNGC